MLEGHTRGVRGARCGALFWGGYGPGVKLVLAVTTFTCTVAVSRDDRRLHPAGLQQYQHQAEATGPGGSDGGRGNGSDGNSAGAGGGEEGGGGDKDREGGGDEGGEAEGGGRQLQEGRLWLGTAGTPPYVVCDASELRLAERGSRVAACAGRTRTRVFVEAKCRLARPGDVPCVARRKRLTERLAEHSVR